MGLVSWAAYSIFNQVRQNAGALFITFGVIKVAFHIAYQWSTSEMIDRAMLAVVYILGYSIYRKEHE